MPDSFNLPKDSQLFTEYKKKHTESCFIGKPPFDSHKGDGIFLFKDIKDLSWRADAEVMAQKYLSKPLLIDGYKFIIKMFVVVVGNGTLLTEDE